VDHETVGRVGGIDGADGEEGERGSEENSQCHHDLTRVWTRVVPRFFPWQPAVGRSATDMSRRAELAPVREELFGRKAPASTTVEVSALAHPGWMVEIEAIAVI
jgi:hypothetical protein